MELPGSGAAAPRAALHARRDLVAARLSDLRRTARPIVCRRKYASIQKNDFSRTIPIILTSGRLVEYEGGGDESRSNPWLAELQQDMFVEINPRDANNRPASRTASMVWVQGSPNHTGRLAR